MSFTRANTPYHARWEYDMQLAKLSKDLNIIYFASISQLIDVRSG